MICLNLTENAYFVDGAELTMKKRRRTKKPSESETVTTTTTTAAQAAATALAPSSAKRRRGNNSRRNTATGNFGNFNFIFKQFYRKYYFLGSDSEDNAEYAVLSQQPQQQQHQQQQPQQSQPRACQFNFLVQMGMNHHDDDFRGMFNLQFFHIPF